MRAGGCTVQQALTPEAASVIKQAVSLARRRGHAQVTPLHVANTMLSSSTGLLRAACLQSHSHPLQCKALELCFNVALNRLPASTSSGPMLGPLHTHHHHPPSLSNALVAAFKRAQAHQRRGSIDTQQQPLLAVKIEIEQLIISILDDPSISRVMREAGFSSTQVKSNVEQAVSLEICTPTPSNANPSKPKADVSHVSTKSTSLLTQPQVSRTWPCMDQVRNEDVTSVVECLISRRKTSIVVVGECLAATGGVVRKVMDKVDKGEVPEILKEVQFISVPLVSFEQLSREEVEKKVGEIRCVVKSCCVGRSGAVLYLGDLKWAAEYRASCGDKGKSYYCPVEHAIMEIGRLVCGGFGEEINVGGGRFWLMGIATYQVYMRCRIGHPSLEAVWCLHPLTVPVGNLGLSLNYDSDLQNQLRSNSCRDHALCWSSLEDGDKDQLNCFETEDQSLPNGNRNNHDSINSTLPSWLRQYEKENKRLTINDEGRPNPQVRDLCRKWNSICNSYHKNHHHLPERTLKFSSAPPSPSSCFDQHYSNLHLRNQSWSVPINTKNTWKQHHFLLSDAAEDASIESSSGIYLQGHRPSPISISSCDTMEMEYHHRFRDLNAENLKTICNALDKKVPWQQDIIPEIASTILQCRSGMMRRKRTPYSHTTRRDTWLFFLGGDVDGKEKVARELSNLVFGSQTSFITIGLNSFSSSRSESADDLQNKRSRLEGSDSILERFAEAVCNNPHSVILMEDIEQVDHHSQMGIKNSIERGRIIVHSSTAGKEVCLSDTVVILSCENFDSRSRACSPPVKQKSDNEEEKGGDSEEASSCFSLDLNLSINDTDLDDLDRYSFDDVGLLELVDARFFFKLPEESQ